jgi:NAD-dependent DNA ligase
MEINKLTKEQLVPQYLIHSFLYYIEEDPVITDASYDKLCRMLLSNFDDINHRHKGLVTKEALRAGTGYHLAENDYPRIVIGAARHLKSRVQ